MTTSKHILKIGRIRENWLENFPQHISINPKSYYQLLIDNDDLTLEFQLTDSNNLTIDLPLLQGYNYDCIVSWGDDEFSTIFFGMVSLFDLPSNIIVSHFTVLLEFFASLFIFTVPL